MSNENKQARREKFLLETTIDLVASLPGDTMAAAYRCVILHWFDPELLAALINTGIPGNLADKYKSHIERDSESIYGELIELPFIEEHPAHHGSGYHELTRNVFLDYIWNADADFCMKVSAAALNYFGQRLSEQDEPDTDDIYEWAYHLINVDEDYAVITIDDMLTQLKQKGLINQYRALMGAAQEQATSGRMSAYFDTSVDFWLLNDASYSLNIQKAQSLANKLLETPDDLVDEEMKAEVCYILAGTYYATGDYGKAAEYYKASLEKYEKLDNVSGVATALLGLGNTSMQRNKYRKSGDYYFRALYTMLRNSAADTDEEGSLNLNDYNINDPFAWKRVFTMDSQETDSSEDGSQKVEAENEAKPDEEINNDQYYVYYFITKKGDIDVGEIDNQEEITGLWIYAATSTIASIWMQLGYYFKAVAKFDYASAAARLAYDMFADLDDDYNLQQSVQLLTSLGAITGSGITAGMNEDIQRTLLERARYHKDRQAELLALQAMASVYMDKSAYAEARSYYIDANKLADELDDKLGRASIMEGIARLDWIENNWAEALQRINNALLIYRSLNHREGEAQALITSGRIELSRHQKMLAEKNYNEAYNLFLNLGVIDGQLEALQALADMCVYDFDYSSAIEYLKRALALVSKPLVPTLKARAMGSLADAYLATKQFEKARISYKNALEYARSTQNRASEADFLIGLGNVELETSNYKAALSSFTRARRIYSDLNEMLSELECLISIMGVELAKNEVRNANKIANEVLTLAKGSQGVTNEVTALQGIARKYALQEMYDEALMALDHALSISEDDVEVLTLKGEYLSDIGEFESSSKLLRHAITLAPNYGVLPASLGWALENCGAKYATDAQMAYRDAIHLQPDDPFAHKGLGNALRLTGDTKHADMEHEKAYELFKRRIQNTDMLEQEGWCLYQLRRYYEAEEVLRQSVVESSRPSDQFDLALVLLCLGRVDEASSIYKQSIKYVETLQLRRQIGLLRIASDDIDEAIQEGRISLTTEAVSEVSSLVKKRLDHVRTVLAQTQTVSMKDGISGYHADSSSN